MEEWPNRSEAVCKSSSDPTKLLRERSENLSMFRSFKRFIHLAHADANAELVLPFFTRGSTFLFLNRYTDIGVIAQTSSMIFFNSGVHSNNVVVPVLSSVLECVINNPSPVVQCLVRWSIFHCRRPVTNFNLTWFCSHDGNTPLHPPLAVLRLPS